MLLLVKVQKAVLLPPCIKPENVEEGAINGNDEGDEFPKFELQSHVGDVRIDEASYAWDAVDQDQVVSFSQDFPLRLHLRLVQEAPVDRHHYEIAHQRNCV